MDSLPFPSPPDPPPLSSLEESGAELSGTDDEELELLGGKLEELEELEELLLEEELLGLALLAGENGRRN